VVSHLTKSGFMGGEAAVRGLQGKLVSRSINTTFYQRGTGQLLSLDTWLHHQD